VTKSTFIVTLVCVVNVTNNIDILSKRLQEKNTSLKEAMTEMQDIITILEGDRQDSERGFAKITRWIVDTVTCLKIKVECPRVCQRSVTPFLDTILEQLRFNEKTTFVGLFDTLLPDNCAKNDAVEEEFMQLYGNYSQFLHANNVMPHDTSGMNALKRSIDCGLLNGRDNFPVQLIHQLIT
jgi:hypothetical protein